jgi:putative endonuclease
MEKSMAVTKNKRSWGAEGENLAAVYLEKNGYAILARNYRVGKMGEVDIIARNREFICFIEVKTRSSTFFGMPSEAVNRKKQATIVKIAWVYLKTHRLTEQNIRFDIVEILRKTTPDGQMTTDIHLIKNAFTGI